jgi:hypothetical protein
VNWLAIWLLFWLYVVLAVSGCAAISPQGAIAPAGTANYELVRGADGSCTLRITSARELTDAKIHLGPDCSLDASSATMNGLAAMVAGQQMAADMLARAAALAAVPK